MTEIEKKIKEIKKKEYQLKYIKENSEKIKTSNTKNNTSRSIKHDFLNEIIKQTFISNSEIVNIREILNNFHSKIKMEDIIKKDKELYDERQTMEKLASIALAKEKNIASQNNITTNQPIENVNTNTETGINNTNVEIVIDNTNKVKKDKVIKPKVIKEKTAKTKVIKEKVVKPKNTVKIPKIKKIKEEK